MMLDTTNTTDISRENLCIHIPWDILSPDDPYKCPTTVTMELTTPKQTNLAKCHHERPSPSIRSQGHLSTTNDGMNILKEPVRPRSLCASDNLLPSVKRRFAQTRCSCNKSDFSPSEVRKRVCPKDALSLQVYGLKQRNSVIMDQEVIEMVAAANEHLQDFTEPTELPELRATPCLMHQRINQTTHLSPHQQQQGQQLLYSTNQYHWGVPPSPGTPKLPAPGAHEQHMEARIQKERSNTAQQDIQNGRRQVYAMPVLPQAMSSKEFINSWLQHGSEPIGHTHFPEVILPRQPANPSNNKPKKVGDVKQTLAPIFRTLKAKKQKRNVQR